MNPAGDSARVLDALLGREPLNLSKAKAVACTCAGPRARVYEAQELDMGWLIQVCDAHLSDATTGQPLTGRPPVLVTRPGGIYEIAGPPGEFRHYSDWVEEFGKDALAMLDDNEGEDPELDEVWNALVDESTRAMLSEYENDLKRFLLVPVFEPIDVVKARKERFMSPDEPGAPGYIRAHNHSSNHRVAVLESKECGCFHCLSQFGPGSVTEWTDMEGETGTTALCPRCGIDSVIGAASGFPTDKHFLRRMQQHWFGEE